MVINTNINIIGGLPDFNLIKYFFLNDKEIQKKHFEFTAIRTEKSVNRFKKAIVEAFDVQNQNVRIMFTEFLRNESIENLNYLLFLLFSFNNYLFNYLNNNVFFPVYFSGRKYIKKEEVLMCMKDLRKSNEELKSWSESTIETTASKYLTLLKKFGLLAGFQKKEIVYKNPSFEEFVVFNYLLSVFEENSNKYNSDWIPYSFYEKDFYIQKILDKKLMPLLEINFNGDNLKIKNITNYKDLYYALKST